MTSVSKIDTKVESKEFDEEEEVDLTSIREVESSGDSKRDKVWRPISSFSRIL